jgi:hypothetical protein
MSAIIFQSLRKLLIDRDADIEFEKQVQHYKDFWKKHGFQDGIYKVETSIKVNELKDGQYVGEMSFLSDGVASATVKTKRQTEIVTWGQKELKDLMKRNPSIIYSLQASMGEQMAKSLKAKNYHDTKDAHSS